MQKVELNESQIWFIGGFFKILFSGIITMVVYGYLLYLCDWLKENIKVTKNNSFLFVITDFIEDYLDVIVKSIWFFVGVYTLITLIIKVHRG